MEAQTDDLLQLVEETSPAEPRKRLKRLKRRSGGDAERQAGKENSQPANAGDVVDPAAGPSPKKPRAVTAGGTSSPQADRVGLAGTLNDGSEGAAGEDNGSDRSPQASGEQRGEGEDLHGDAGSDVDPDYWDEEDEYADYINRRDKQLKEQEQAAAAAATKEADEGSSEEDGSAAGSVDGSDAEEEDGDPSAVAQRMLRDQARYDTLGKGHQPVMVPLAGVLGKLKARVEKANARCPADPGRRAMDSVLANLGRHLGNAAAAADNDEEDDLEILPDASDEDDDAAADEDRTEEKQDMALPASPATDEADGSDADTEAEEGSDEDEEGEEAGGVDQDAADAGDSGAQGEPRAAAGSQAAAAGDGSGMKAFQRRRKRPSEVAQASAAAAAVAAQVPAPSADGFLHLALDPDSEEQQGSGLGLHQGEEGDGGPAAASRDARRQGQEEVGEGEEEEEKKQGGDAGSPGGAKEEEAGQGGDAGSLGDAGSGGAAGPAAADGAAKKSGVLASFKGPSKKDMRRAKRFYELEAELSDEEGGVRAPDSDDDDDDDDMDADLEDLIANEPVGGNPEEESAGLAQLHARWQQQHDADALRQLIEGVKNGFQRRGGGINEVEGDDRLARLRRAVAAYDEEGAEGFNPALFDVDALLGLLGDAGLAGGGGPAADLSKADAEWLDKYKERRALSAAMESRGPDIADLRATLLDEGSQQVLGLLAAGSSAGGNASRLGPAAEYNTSNHNPQQQQAVEAGVLQPPPLPVMAVPGRKAKAGGVATAAGAGGKDAPRPVTVGGLRPSSFLGRAASLGATRSSVLVGGTNTSSSRSFVFGRGDDSSHSNAAQDEQQRGEPGSGGASFAGVTQRIASMGKARGSGSGQQHQPTLLGMLGPKGRAGSSAAGGGGNQPGVGLPIPQLHRIGSLPAGGRGTM